MIGTCIVYAPVLIVKVICQWQLPEHLFQNLDASLRLRSTSYALARKVTIDAFVDQSIKALNAKTCSLNSQVADVCDQPVFEGLKSMLLPIVDRPQQILDCEMAHFTVGVIVDYAELQTLELTEPVDEDSLWFRERTFFSMFRDDLGLKKQIFENVFKMNAPKGVALELLHSIQKAKNENTLDVRPVSMDNGQVIQLISSPIPMVCEENSPIGVIWVFRECDQIVPEDLDNILRIFGRIAANWLSKFDECHRNRLIAQNLWLMEKQATEP
ncbi:MAG TPA: hypothetical protein DCP71_03355 [Verrucomicrobiales bacterium]|nr:hypothetical protein [Verrucomicrobiales bacterium]